MSQSLVVKVATLVFAAGGLTALVLHGCSKPQPAAIAPTEQAAATPSASSAPSAEPEEDPPFLGATKAAMPIPPKSGPPKKKNPAPQQQK